MSLFSDLKVFFVDMSLLADEKWHVAGQCTVANVQTKIHVVDMALLADKKIYLVDMALLADKKICITNSSDAPDEFWKAYRD